jgi:hypothetical protein
MCHGSAYLFDRFKTALLAIFQLKDLVRILALYELLHGFAAGGFQVCVRKLPCCSKDKYENRSSQNHGDSSGGCGV